MKALTSSLDKIFVNSFFSLLKDFSEYLQAILPKNHLLYYLFDCNFCNFNTQLVCGFLVCYLNLK